VARRLAAGMDLSFDIYRRIDRIADAVKEQKGTRPADAAGIADVEKQIHALQEGTHDAPGMGPVNRDLSRLLDSVEGGDQRPTDPQMQAVTETCSLLDKQLKVWNDLNQQLRQHNPLGLPIAPVAPTPGCK
jgi:hypothetical protein